MNNICNHNHYMTHPRNGTWPLPLNNQLLVGTHDVLMFASGSFPSPTFSRKKAQHPFAPSHALAATFAAKALANSAARTAWCEVRALRPSRLLNLSRLEDLLTNFLGFGEKVRWSGPNELANRSGMLHRSGETKDMGCPALNQSTDRDLNRSSSTPCSVVNSKQTPPNRRPPNRAGLVDASG